MNRRHFLKSAAALSATANLTKAGWGLPPRLLLYCGTRAAGPGKGISSCFFDPTSGDFSALKLVAEIASPTAFAVASDLRTLYAVSETGNDGKSDGAVTAFRIDRSSGGLTLLNRVPSGGGGPTYLSLDRTGRTLAVGCFGAGRTNTFALRVDGQLGEQVSTFADSGTGPSPRQASPHVHCAVFSPGNRFVLSADFGADRIYLFHFNAATGALTPAEPAFVQCTAGSGPRQLVFHPNGKFVFLLSELAATVTVYAWSENDGTLREVQSVSCVPEGASERSGAGIAVHLNGRFLYTTTRSDNSIEVFAIEPAQGRLTSVQRVPAEGKLPWSCVLDPASNYFLTTNFASNSLALYGVDAGSGKLTLRTTLGDVPAPVAAVCL